MAYPYNGRKGKKYMTDRHDRGLWLPLWARYGITRGHVDLSHHFEGGYRYVG